MYMLTLKPQDIAVMLKLIANSGRWTIAAIARDMYLSPSEVHAALSRAELAKLFDRERRSVRTNVLGDFMIHGLQYVFLGVKGAITRGMPTSIAAPPLVYRHFDEPDLPPVWPHPMGLKRGYAIQPLYKRAPDAAAADSPFYELLALTDALREGTARVRSVAIAELKERFDAYAKYAGGPK